ncbi:hypothetical protein CLONEX_02452 [[Clostridium] nexile DSM 1787]|nr:hypothetical protein CLONEX_02452 [[Clostridium] nexile DSM 1787]
MYNTKFKIIDQYLDQKCSQNAQPQNEILCSKGLGGAALNKQAERKITDGFSSLRVGVY